MFKYKDKYKDNTKTNTKTKTIQRKIQGVFITVGDLVMDLFRYPIHPIHPSIRHIALIVPNCSKPFNTELRMNW